MTYSETVFLFVSVLGFSGVGYLLYSIRQNLKPSGSYSADLTDNND
jgi:hypothetical protein